MACLLQTKCNFLHSFFRCKLLVEVVDVEVKITSMQGIHIFRRDRTTQLIKCTPWSTRLCPHPTIIKKMKIFLEVEGKMEPIPTPGSQFRPPLPDTNPNIRKDTLIEKRKRAMPKKKFRPATPKPATAHPPLPEAPPKPKSDASLPSVPAWESTPWPGTGKMSGNLFEDRNWLLPQNYLSRENKNENGTSVTSPWPPIKEEEPKANKQSLEKDTDTFSTIIRSNHKDCLKHLFVNITIEVWKFLILCRCPHYIFCKISSDQIKIVHFRPKIRNLQHVNTDLFGMCATRLIPAYY